MSSSTSLSLSDDIENSNGKENKLDEAHKKVLARRLSQRHNLTDGYTNNLDIRSSDEVSKVKDNAANNGEVKANNEKKKDAKLAGWKHFLAGGIAGACEVFATMPLDVAKTQMQINPGKYKGPIDALRRIAGEVCFSFSFCFFCIFFDLRYRNRF